MTTGYGVKGGFVRNCHIHAKAGDGHDQVATTGGTYNSYIRVDSGNSGHDGITAYADTIDNIVEHTSVNGGSAIKIEGALARVYGGIIIGKEFGTSRPLHIAASNAIVENVSIRNTYNASSQQIIYIDSGITGTMLLNLNLEKYNGTGTHKAITAADDDTPVHYAGIKFVNKSSGTLDPIDEAKISQQIENTTDPYGNLVVN